MLSVRDITQQRGMELDPEIIEKYLLQMERTVLRISKIIQGLKNISRDHI